MQNGIKIVSLRNIIEKINGDLGEFTETFRYKRKELANHERASTKGILFKYIEEKEERDWAINEGGGTQVQYHLNKVDDSINYGIGFNTQYVPHATNEKPPVEYMQPYADAFWELRDTTLVRSLRAEGFKFSDDQENEFPNLKKDCHYLFGKRVNLYNGSMFTGDYNRMLNEIKGELFDLYCQIFEGRNINLETKEANMDFVLGLKSLLENNKNLILTGAPGTGKTYLAREIAKAMGAGDEETEFVQFHPSYDYTDFVEGLRPFKKENSELGFELKDGVFKQFCKKAAKNFEDSKKPKAELQKQQSLSDSLSQFISEIQSKVEENGFFELRGIGGKPCAPIVDISEKSFCTKSKNGNKLVTPLSDILDKYEVFATHRNINWSFKEVKEKISSYHQTYFFAFLNAFDEFVQKHKNDFSEENVEPVEEKKYVFIIDEINRAEISKVFGELFYAIDPGYRGSKGKVKTQYANLHEDGGIFKDGFYIPENVYLIGTMNDIDRSVESFDFAMRRRFAWEEIRATDRTSMWDGQIDQWKEEAKERMKALNTKIEEMQGLGSAFHIGPAYFLKLKDNNGDFQRLWDHHLKGVLFEYLRGMPDSEEQLKELENAYERKLQESEDNNNRQ